MALRGFSCRNCHTWFEGEGNHPRCPLCGTRASPRDLLDDRGQAQPASQQAATAWDFEGPDFELPDLERSVDFELPTRHAPDYEVSAEQPPDYEVPQSHEQGSRYDEVRHYEAPQGGDATRREAPDKEYEAPAGAPERQSREDSGGSWGDRIGPLIGAAIFVAIIASRICGALTDSE